MSEVSNFFASKAKKQAAANANNSENKSRGTELPWVEKYRPKKVDEVAHQDEVTRTLAKSIETGNLPHLLFYGPPGTGKTSTILAIARQLYGFENMKQCVLELNASDERGISVVRNKVKVFAQLVTANVGKEGHPNPVYKLIILDEADSMTPDAQSALRRTIENYSKSTRFCLICNYVTRIIEPLASRCAKFRFKPLSDKTLQDRLQYIAEKEGFVCSDEVLNQLSIVSGGDMRRAITILQSAYRLDGDQLSGDSIIEIAGRIHDDVILELIDTCKSNSFDKLQSYIEEVVANGYSAFQFISQLTEMIVKVKDLTDVQKAKICIKISEIDQMLVEGSDEYLQLLDLGSYITQTLCKN